MSTTLSSVACDIPASHVDALAKMLGGLRLDEAPAVNVDALAEMFDGWHLSEAPAYEEPPAYCKMSAYFKELPPAYGEIDLPSDDFVREWVWEAPDVVARHDWFMPTYYTDDEGVSFDHLRWRRRWVAFARAHPDDHHNYLLRSCCGRVDLEARFRTQTGREFYLPGMQPFGRRPEPALLTTQDVREWGRATAPRSAGQTESDLRTEAAREAFRQCYRMRVIAGRRARSE